MRSTIFFGESSFGESGRHRLASKTYIVINSRRQE